VSCPFKVGEWIKCDCGVTECVPFQIKEIRALVNNEKYIICGNDFAYVYPEDSKLRHLTKLEQVMK
jgi:hypothetical protein